MSNARTARPVGWTGPTGAQVVKHLRGWSPLDNHTPARRDDTVAIEVIEWPARDDGFTGVELEIVGGLDVFRHGAQALWAVDDGAAVRLYYTCTYHPEHRHIGLKRLTPGLDVGPRTTYYVRVTEV